LYYNAAQLITIPNETDMSAPRKTLTAEHTNQIGSPQAIVASDANIAFAERNLFLVFQHQQSFSEFCPCLSLC